MQTAKVILALQLLMVSSIFEWHSNNSVHYRSESCVIRYLGPPVIISEVAPRSLNMDPEQFLLSQEVQVQCEWICTIRCILQLHAFGTHVVPRDVREPYQRHCIIVREIINMNFDCNLCYWYKNFQLTCIMFFPDAFQASKRPSSGSNYWCVDFHLV
jgi:hypothetical protein